MCPSPVHEGVALIIAWVDVDDPYSQSRQNLGYIIVIVCSRQHESSVPLAVPFIDIGRAQPVLHDVTDVRQVAWPL